MASNFLVMAAVLMLSANSVLGLKCYTCDSSKGMTCNFGLLWFTYDSVECAVKSGSGFIDTIASIIPTNCVKLVGKDHDGNEYTARGCAPSTGLVNTCSALAKIIQFGDSKDISSLDCFVCDTDNCNSASKFGGMTLVALLLASITFLF